jgi:NADPH:quinone reductase-like Zn-dependent oxidoreductase
MADDRMLATTKATVAPFGPQRSGDQMPSAALPRIMRAVQVGAFGGIEQLHLSSISVPTPRKGEVLVRVGAAGVGPWDALIREGRSGLPVTLPVTLGADVSGVIVDVGDDVEGLAPGDAVFGVTNDRFVGAYAEFALADAFRLARKPVGLGFIEAGGMPVVAVTARSMLFEHGGLRRGQRVLVHGSAGAVGNLVIQLAHGAGAEVIATCRARDIPFVTKMGADEVIDFEATDFVLGTKPVNLVIDTVGGETQRRSFDVIAPGGRLVSVVSAPNEALAAKAQVQAYYFIVDVRRPELSELGELFADGVLQANIGEVLPLAEAPLAHQMLAGRPHRRGKIVLEIEPGL